MATLAVARWPQRSRVLLVTHTSRLSSIKAIRRQVSDVYRILTPWTNNTPMDLWLFEYELPQIQGALQWRPPFLQWERHATRRRNRGRPQMGNVGAFQFAVRNPLIVQLRFPLASYTLFNRLHDLILAPHFIDEFLDEMS